MGAVAIDHGDSLAARFWESTNGKKVVMAITGAILFGFVIVHLIGNLQAFEGPEKFNDYAKFLRVEPTLLWAFRLFMLSAVTLHIVATVQLALRKKAARPVAYRSSIERRSSNYSSRTMYWSGPILLAFIIYHLLHLTAGIIHPGAHFVEGNVYQNLVAGFRVWWVSAWYIFSMILLGTHIRHGAWSMFQSLGVNHPRHTPIMRKGATTLAVLITLGYISIPVAVLVGVVR